MTKGFARLEDVPAAEPEAAVPRCSSVSVRFISRPHPPVKLE